MGAPPGDRAIREIGSSDSRDPGGESSNARGLPPVWISFGRRRGRHRSRSASTLTASLPRLAQLPQVWIALLSAAGILIHLCLRYLVQVPVEVSEIPLYVAV